MIDYLIFERENGDRLNPQDLGLILKSFSSPPPAPKLYYESIEGRDGDLDMTEWAGEIRYNNRDVTAAFLDMSGKVYERLLQFLHGRKVKIYHSLDLEHYFEGRCEKAEAETKSHVTSVGFSFSCHPYRRADKKTVHNYTLSGAQDILLQAERESVSPTFTLSAPMTVRTSTALYSMGIGTATIPNLIIRDSPTVIGVNGTGTMKIEWRDGVL